MKYFGTDGIRGKFGQYPITEVFFSQLATALEKFFLKKSGSKELKVCIGRDTRASGKILFNALISGFSEDVTVFDVEILPTPAIAESGIFLKSDFSIAITASHNEHFDNGIKIFNSNGEKLTIQDEIELESILDDLKKSYLLTKSLDSKKIVKITNQHVLAKNFYCEKYKSFLPKNSLVGKTIIIDSANGATFDVAKTIFQYFGANVIHIGNVPNGSNINENYGSEHTSNLENAVISNNAILGIAYDGDGDRTVIFDENGKILNGDVLIGILAEHMFSSNDLPNNSLVTTIQSNLALDKYLHDIGIKVIRCDVGDRNVYQSMLQNDCHFGGETSGHLIFRKFSKVGDGITTSIYLISVLLSKHIKLSQLKTKIALFPQKFFNVTMREKIPLSEIGNLEEEISKIESELPSPNRVLVRYSGTEPKLRVLVESPDPISVDTAWGNLQNSIIKNMDKDDIYDIVA